MANPTSLWRPPAGERVDPTSIDAQGATLGHVATVTSDGSGGQIYTPQAPGASYTDEAAQDAVGLILDDSGDIDFTYDDATPKITALVKAGVVTWAKIQNMTSGKLLGRSTAGSGSVEELTVGSGLTLAGGTLSATGGGSYTDEQAQDAVGAMVDSSLVYVDATPLLTRAALTGDVTASQGSNATTIANDAVTFAKMQNIATNKLLGRSTASSGDIEELTVGSGLSLAGGSLSATGGSADHAYFTYLAASLEPQAIEVLNIDTFSYVIGSSVTKLVHSMWQARINGGGRLDRRDMFGIMPMRNTTIVGTADGSALAVIDPALPTYTDARTTYYDRLATIATSDTKYFALAAPDTFYPLLPGPYGSIITHTTTFDLTWIALVLGPTYGGGRMCLPITNEIGDDPTSPRFEYQRVTSNALIPLSKNICCGILTGLEKSSGVGKGGVTFIICPADWGAVVDPNTYIFRDDFLGATLDTGSTWTRAQSTAGNVEINTDLAWCKVKGNDNWGDNGAFSQTTTARATGKKFEIDVFTNDGVGATTAGAPNLIVGFHDGSGQSFSDFAHGIYFTQSGGTRALFAFEGGTSRGAVGTGYSLNTIYRVRITLGASNTAVYEIQGGDQYALIGSASWTTITPGTTSNSTTPLAAGFAQVEDSVTFVSDPKIYT